MNDKVILVSGAGKGIGKAIVLAFAKQGSKVAFFDHNQDRVKEVSNSLKKLGVKYLSEVIDGTQLNKLDQFLTKVNQTLGPVDILINNLGVGLVKRFDQTTSENFDQVINTNLKAAFFLTQQAVKTMKAGSNIIFISSIHAEHPSLDPTYDGSKAFINNLILNLSLELAKKQIRVNGIAPGHIDTSISLSANPERAERVEGVDVETKNKPRKQPDVPLFKAAGLPEDVAQACLFLADNEKARYITGAILPVTGGLHIPIARDIQF